MELSTRNDPSLSTHRGNRAGTDSPDFALPRLPKFLSDLSSKCTPETLRQHRQRMAQLWLDCALDAARVIPRASIENRFCRLITVTDNCRVAAITRTSSSSSYSSIGRFGSSAMRSKILMVPKIYSLRYVCCRFSVLLASKCHRFSVLSVHFGVRPSERSSFFILLLPSSLHSTLFCLFLAI